MINNPVAPVLNNAAGLGTLIGNLIAIGMIIAGIMVLLYLILGGIEWISSGGDKAGLESARNRITNALIGLAIVVSAWAIMTIVSTFLGLSFPCLPIPTLDGVKSTCATPGTGGVCPKGDQGQPGETCSNTNKCDIAGGCNPACCVVDSECTKPGEKCGWVSTGSDYCRLKKSCVPK